MRHISLWNLCGAAVIVPANTGVIYANQVNGTACFQEQLEGLLVPLNNDYLPQEYEQSLEFELRSLFRGPEAFNVEKARHIQAALERFQESSGVIVNMARVTESYEAWVHVTLHDVEFSSYSGLEGAEGVLTWPNSD
jgi:hypothetical protein